MGTPNTTCFLIRSGGNIWDSKGHASLYRDARAHVDLSTHAHDFCFGLEQHALCSRTGSDLTVSRVGTCGLGMPKRGHETAVHLRAAEQRTHAKKTPCPSYLPALIFQPEPVSWGISSGKFPQVIRLFSYSCQITSANAIAPPQVLEMDPFLHDHLNLEKPSANLSYTHVTVDVILEFCQ